MNWIITENNRKINALDIPTISLEDIKVDVEKMKIGTPLSVRTSNNIILDTYISAIKDDGSNFIEITCGNMRINFIDKILKERNK